MRSADAIARRDALKYNKVYGDAGYGGSHSPSRSPSPNNRQYNRTAEDLDKQNSMFDDRGIVAVQKLLANMDCAT